MYLGIEIGGTKLQLAVGAGDGSPLAELLRFDVQPGDGAGGILRQIEAAAPELIRRHNARAIGVGFGGPAQGRAGRVVKSHHVSGWEGFELAAWCREKFGLPAVVANDCDAAALAEARFGAGQGRSPVFYVTVGTGIGGGLVIDGQLYQGHGHAVAEIGHLRPGLAFNEPEKNLESIAAGWGIAARAKAKARQGGPRSTDRADLLDRCTGEPDKLTARAVVEAAQVGNELALEILYEATTSLGWAIAQVITLISPAIVVIGGGVSLAGEELFFEPVRLAVEQYDFPPLQGSYEIVPAKLGEGVVLHGALALARDASG
jgi:glucokinase